MKANWKSLLMGLFIGVGFFSLFSFKALQSEKEKGFILIVYTKTTIEISLGDSRHETIELRSGMYKQNDNTLISVLNRFANDGYRLIGTNSPNLGEVYYVMQR